jgi:hypothetical protein
VAADNHEFQGGSSEFKAGRGRVISIKLIHKRAKRPVSGAAVVSTALDISPENMADTKGKIATDTSTGPKSIASRPISARQAFGRCS